MLKKKKRYRRKKEKKKLLRHYVGDTCPCPPEHCHFSCSSSSLCVHYTTPSRVALSPVLKSGGESASKARLCLRACVRCEELMNRRGGAHPHDVEEEIPCSYPDPHTLGRPALHASFSESHWHPGPCSHPVAPSPVQMRGTWTGAEPVRFSRGLGTETQRR